MFGLFGKSKILGAVSVCSVDRAGDIARETGAKLIISISDPERRTRTRELIGPGKWKVCELDFHDIERAAPELIAPQMSHIEKALSASEKIPFKGSIVVHCQAGISRSAAIALIVGIHRGLKFGFTEAEALDRSFADLLASSPHACPNMEMIDLGVKKLFLEETFFKSRAWDLHFK